MAERIQLDVITPERRLLSETVDAVTVPGMNGEIGILPGHTPLISQLQTGVLTYTQGTTTHRMVVSGGFVEVNEERVSVLADLAERPDEVDATQARQEREAVEKALGSFSGSEEEMTQMRTRLERAAARLELSSGR
ncbi:MAG: F0F1 ATP synthase subunit epsilon [Acidobacteriota bacterium]|nr:F0F1 ATP synthase subunit epsilon [Acidobacteriota bacterium]